MMSPRFTMEMSEIEKFQPSAVKGFITEEQAKICYEVGCKDLLKRLTEVIKITPGLMNLSINRLTLEELIMNAEGPLFVIASQIFNNCLYFHGLRMQEKGGESMKPSTRLMDLITREYQSLDVLREHFVSVAETVFASGWCFLVLDPVTFRIRVTAIHGAGSPIRGNLGIPLLAVNLFEHAFVLDYKGDRRQYLTKFFEVINWEFVNERFEIVSRMVQEGRKVLPMH